MVREECRHICFAFVFACGVGKNQKTPNLGPIADNVITQAVYKVWDLPCISVDTTV